MNHHDPIRTGVNVQLDRLGTPFQGSEEGGKGVLGELAGGAAVADPLDAPRGGWNHGGVY
jgi:hypothetical protein